MTQPAYAEETKGNEAASQPFRVIGYYSGDLFRDPVENLQTDKLTHVMYAFLIPNEDGTCRPMEKPDKLKAVVEKSHQTGTKVFIAVGGWSYQGIPLVTTFEKIGASEVLREKLTDSIVEFVKEYNLDGVDFDWEHPNYKSAANYEKTVLLLKAKLEPMDKELSVSVSRSENGIQGGEAISSISEKTLQAYDFINLMCYDLRKDGQHSPIWLATSSIDYWVNRGVPEKKIVLGMPLYARPSWMQYRDLVAKDPGNAYKDYAATVPLDSYYNGLNTLREKTILAMQRAGGVMLFDVNEDTLNETSAVSMIHETISSMSDMSREQLKSNINMVIKHKPILFSAEDGMGMPYVDKNNRVLVPVRKLLESVGASVNFEETSRMVTAAKGSTKVKIKIGDNGITVNDKRIVIDTKAVIKDGRTYLPARAVLEAFGYSLTWSEAGKTVYAD